MRYRPIIFILPILFLIEFTHVLHGQSQPLTFDRYSVEQGLSQSIVLSILQDSRGFLWFGTEDGLNLYDGYTFTVLRSDPMDEFSLSYNQVNVIYEDRSGAIWVGTFNGGLNRYVMKQNKFLHYRTSASDSTSLSNDIVTCMVEDRWGNLWIGTVFGLNRIVKGRNPGDRPVFDRFFSESSNSRSLSSSSINALCLDSTGTLWIGTASGLNSLASEELCSLAPRFTRYLHASNNPRSLSNDLIRSLHVDRSGTLWVGTDHGLNRCPTKGPASFRRYLVEEGNPGSLSNAVIYAILEDREGILWVGTDGGGLNRFDPASGMFSHYMNNPRDPNSLGYNEIRSIYQDRSGLLWIGTYGAGVNKVDPRPKQFKIFRPDLDNPNSLNQEIVWCVYEDKDGILWIGTHGGGLNRFDRVRNRFTHYRHNPHDPTTLSSDIVRLVVPDPGGDLWIGTNGGGLCLFNPRTEKFRRYRNDPGNPQSLSNDNIRELYLDSRGVLWIGTNGGGMNSFDTRQSRKGTEVFVRYLPEAGNPNSFNSLYPRAIHEDEDGILWIGTLGGGLNRFDRTAGTFSAIRSDPRNPNSLNHDFVFCIHETKDGILWLGTWGGGLNRYDPKTGIVKHYTHREGLPSDAIYGILEDGAGNLWFSSNFGLSKFDPRTGHCRNYTMKDGLQSNEFNGGSFFKSPSGEMFFGGINGFNAFFPDSIKDNPSVPPVVITSFRKFNNEVAFDRPLSEVKEITLSYRDYIFSFEFAALDYNAPDMNQYAYMMEGLDDDWVSTTSKKRFAQYTTLNPGTYVFRVKGSNNDGVWNDEGVALKIIITPPYYQTWWFRSGVVLLIAVLVLAWYRRHLKTVQMRTELEAAHRAQMSIMPQSDPVVEGFDVSGSCIPANEVGGDFFDYIWSDTDTKRFGIVVGDVAGKAMNAAMTAILTSGIINAEARNGSSVGQVLSKANQLLYPKTERKTFTALCLVSLDLKKREVVFANAGLMKPILKSRNQVVLLEASGSTHALGMLAKSDYREKKVGLVSGDVLLLQTDGISEAQDHARRFYGEERVQMLVKNLDTRALSAREIKEAIFADVRRFVGTTRQFDDMTIVIVKVL